jgi:hypothetical protein
MGRFRAPRVEREFLPEEASHPFLSTRDSSDLFSWQSADIRVPNGHARHHRTRALTIANRRCLEGARRAHTRKPGSSRWLSWLLLSVLWGRVPPVGRSASPGRQAAQKGASHSKILTAAVFLPFWVLQQKRLRRRAKEGLESGHPQTSDTLTVPPPAQTPRGIGRWWDPTPGGSS